MWGPKFLLFFFLFPPHDSSFLFSLGVFSWNVGGVFEAPGKLKCARLEFSGCRVKPRRPRRSWGRAVLGRAVLGKGGPGEGRSWVSLGWGLRGGLRGWYGASEVYASEDVVAPSFAEEPIVVELRLSQLVAPFASLDEVDLKEVLETSCCDT